MTVAPGTRTPQTRETQTDQFDAGFLRPERAANYFEEARKSSIVMQMARQIPVGINGQEFAYSTAKATAGWVGEGGQKPTTESAIALKSFKPAKIAAISVVSAEVVRANPGNYMEILRADIAEAFAIAFDNAVLHGTNAPAAFGAALDTTTKVVELGTTSKANGGVYGDIVTGLKLLTDAGKKMTGLAFDKKVEPTFLGAVDNNGRPLFVDATYTAGQSVVPGRIIGRPAVLGDNIATPIVSGTPNTGGIVGYAGDWSQIVWGVVSGISYDVSTEATVSIGGELKSLWEHNLVAIRVEAEYGVLHNGVDNFVVFTDNTV